MDILDLNKKAWNNIGEKVANPYIKYKKYLEMFNLFCGSLSQKASVLDLGCGPGIPVTKALVDEGFNVTAIDISEKMIELARENVPEAEYSCMSMTDIDFREKFDGIISSYAMLLLDPEDFRKTAEKISTALKENGLFLLSLNEPSPGHKEEENFINVMGQDMYSRPYTENEIRNVFSEYGMKILKTEREIVISEDYGKEYSLIVLMQKLSSE